MTDTRFLTDDEIAQAVRLDALGQSTAEIAAAFGVSQRHVARRDARNRRVFVPVPEPLGHGGHHAGGPGDG